MTSLWDLSGRAWRMLPSWFLVLALSAAPRLGHLTGPLDEPHSWRQADTAFYAWRFYRDGIELLHPAVSWLGPHHTYLLEFPLPEAVVALCYRLFGYDLVYARLLTLACFCGANWYLWLIARRLFGVSVAYLSAIFFSLAPLSLFFSRAVHVDFVAVFFCHAFVHHALVARERLDRDSGWRGWLQIALSSVAGVLAFLIKAPYAFYLVLPLVVAVGWPPWRRAGLGLALTLVSCSLAFLLWRAHVHAMNSPGPDFGYLPGYLRGEDAMVDYFGTLAMRLDPHVWLKILRRVVLEVAGLTVFPLAAGGLVLLLRSSLKTRAFAPVFVTAWLVGAAAYCAIFLNLNHLHNYYQIPLIAITALGAGFGADYAYTRLAVRSQTRARLFAVVAAGLVVAANFGYARRAYYFIDLLRAETASILQRRTPETAYVVLVSEFDTQSRDPRVLGRAQRFGWPIELSEMRVELVERLKKDGATWLAVVSTSRPSWLADVGPVAEYPLLSTPGWSVRLVPLR